MLNMIQKPDTEHSSRSTHFSQTNGVYYLIFNVINMYNTRKKKYIYQKYIAT